MILPFMTKFSDGTPTYFIHKIWNGIAENCPDEEYVEELFRYHKYEADYIEKFGSKWDFRRSLISKIHTIREDKSNRWKPGAVIDFYINSRTKDMFRFAPRIPVVSTQVIQICHSVGSAVVFIDGEFFGEIYHHGLDDIYEWTDDLKTLAVNDGFDSLEKFFQHFNKDLIGKIIHWTELKY